MAATVAVLAATGAQAAAPPTPSLTTCVTRWNGAALGDGRPVARAVAGGSRRALVFAFRDGACGVAFPTKAAQSAGLGVFIADLGGDWVLDRGPLGTPAARAAEPRLEALAAHRPNATVVPGTGALRADRHATAPREAIAAVDTSAPCDVVETGVDRDAQQTSYRVTERSGARCVDARIVGWAWHAGQGVKAAAPAGGRARWIAGWLCTGPTTTGPVTCTRGTARIALTPLQPNVG
jgi:hypothetical protein